MNRNDFQLLVEIRLREAKVLLDHQCFDGAYYLLGYAVECALKSCICKQFREFDFPDKRTVEKSYSHDLNELLRVAKLDGQFKNDCQLLKTLQANWTIVTNWSEQVRYQHHIAQTTAQEFYEAITETQTGILSWLKNFM